MKQTELELHFPLEEPVKKARKDRLIVEIISNFKSVGDSSARVKDSYYESKRVMPEVVTWVLVVLTALANTATIALAIREFLKKNPEVKEVRIQTKSIKIVIKGNMSDEDVLKTIAEGRKLIESGKSK